MGCGGRRQTLEYAAIASSKLRGAGGGGGGSVPRSSTHRVTDHDGAGCGEVESGQGATATPPPSGTTNGYHGRPRRRRREFVDSRATGAEHGTEWQETEIVCVWQETEIVCVWGVSRGCSWTHASREQSVRPSSDSSDA